MPSFARVPTQSEAAKSPSINSIGSDVKLLSPSAAPAPHLPACFLLHTAPCIILQAYPGNSLPSEGVQWNMPKLCVCLQIERCAVQMLDFS